MIQALGAAIRVLSWIVCFPVTLLGFACLFTELWVLGIIMIVMFGGWLGFVEIVHSAAIGRSSSYRPMAAEEAKPEYREESNISPSTMAYYDKLFEGSDNPFRIIDQKRIR